MTDTRKKLEQAKYFYAAMEQLFLRDRSEFEFHVDAFLNAARNVTNVMNSEYADADGYEGWLPQQPLTASDIGRKFVALRNVSVKIRSVGAQHSEIRFDFGPEGLQGKGNMTVLGPAIAVGEPVAEYVTVRDDDGERQVKVTVTQDFVVEETYDSRKKTVSSSNFLAEAREYLHGLEQLVTECERRFGARQSEA